MNRMYGICIALAFALPNGDYYAQVEAVKADFYHYGSDARYLYLGTVPLESREQAFQALCFKLPHLSRSTVLEHQLPVRVGNTDMYRIDIELLGWGQEAWITLAKEYPFNDFIDPLVINGAWLLRITSDASDSQAYYTLLYAGVGTPKNRDEFLKVWNIVVNDDLRTGVIIDEGKSGVSYRSRLMVEGDAPAGNWFETFDTIKGFGKNDPLEQIFGKFKFDAQEAIVPKLVFDLKTGERGIVLVYWLNDANGKRQDEAPTNIVRDHTNFLGEPSIRVPGSCMNCHIAFNGPSENTFREWIADGIERIEKSKEIQEFQERFYLSQQGKIVKRLNEDFATFTEAACGLEPAAALKAWRDTVHGYEAPLSLDQAAREVYARDADELRNAIALYSDRIGPQEGIGRLASLAHGRTVSRAQWEGDKKNHVQGVFHQAAAAMAAWRADK